MLRGFLVIQSLNGWALTELCGPWLAEILCSHQTELCGSLDAKLQGSSETELRGSLATWPSGLLGS